MKTIWKFPIPLGAVPIEMPRGARVLSVGQQQDQPMLWALVDPAKDVERRVFLPLGTGHSLPDDVNVEWEFLGTTHLRGGAIVVHVFEAKL